METRIYRVIDGGEQVLLIEAASAAAAVRYCAGQRYEVDVAKPKQIAELMARGVKLELARPESDA